MAATSTQLVDLRQVDLLQLEPLLADETAEWAQVLDWDFTENARQVRRFAGPRTLPGVALLDGGQVAGYGYTVLEHPKAIIGDVYLRPAWRGVDSEARLFQVLLDALAGTDGIDRIESQLLLVPPHHLRRLTQDRCVRLFDRRLLSRNTRLPLPRLRGFDSATRFRFEPWDAQGFDSLPRLITRAYQGHIDSQINDQFTTEFGAHNFLRALHENTGCGDFFRPASFFVIDRYTEWMAGAILTSFVGPDTAHITQICVAPEAQGAGLGRELLRRSMAVLAQSGAHRVTLTVTSTNTAANRLYDTAGFQELRSFCAIVRDTRAHMSHSC